ncbi:MAG: ACP S-malonyltransferase [Alphaproteobacteria bacterium]|nr:ACP S-malonyltransferase [Alphaproteobacteria bacterium]MBL0718078.1 ACP S-malonyltransferase [Alphaproteobacteria bacterium]
MTIKRLLLFPGQGTQTVGMGNDIFETFELASVFRFRMANLISVDLFNLMQDGPKEELNLSMNSQPAIVTMSLAIMKILEEKSGKSVNDFASALLGHSLGEYTATAVADFLSDENIVQIVKTRGEFMQEATQEIDAGMGVILGLDIESIESICKSNSENNKVCVVANDNCNGQVTISGHKDVVQKVLDLAKEKGAKRGMILPIASAPHSPLMKLAQTNMEELLSRKDFNKNVIPVLSNRTTEIVNDGKIWRDLLVQQMTQGVRFRECILNAHKLGFNQFVEIGPGNVLSNLVKKIIPDADIISVNSVESINEFVDTIKKENL